MALPKVTNPVRRLRHRDAARVPPRIPSDGETFIKHRNVLLVRKLVFLTARWKPNERSEWLSKSANENDVT